ncbi:MAG TPA: EAL domain-containing protein [Anaerolineales bacterium]|nr:EAL domain-containing protein [Anaerolineales bacterium]
MSKERIFIAEDERKVASEIATSLEKLGYIVAGQADRGETTIQMVEELNPDLVLMEIRLKGQVNGIEAAKHIHTDFDIPVVFISAHADTLTLQTAMLAHAYGFMIKPFEGRELKSNITMALYKHSMTRKLRESEERYALAVRAANDGIWDWNLKTSEIYYSIRWKEMLGYKENEIGTDPNDWFKLVHPDDQKAVQANLDSHFKGSTSHFECEYRIRHSNGTYLWVLNRGLAVRDTKGAPYRMAGSQSDITARKLAEERLAHDAIHDALTGLPNRVLFLDRLHNRLERTKRHPNDLFAVMFIDLDRFKVVNDSLGHAVGDHLLITVANRLRMCLRPDDTVSRLSGDEFAILLDIVKNRSDACGVADRIRGQLKTTTMLGAVERFPTASIGIAMFDKSYSKAEELLRDADAAMYHAKSLGGNQYQIFDSSMHTSAVELIQLEGELKRAVERKEWLIHYQPIISLTSGKPVGAEALVRWSHPHRGVLPPKEFIDVAEDTGLILSIGEYVLHTACTQAKDWREAGHSNIWVSVNLSGRQFQDKNLVEKVTQILSETALPSDGLRLEITESIAIRDMDYTNKVLNKLDALGVRTSLDDFGTGYSSLSYLKQFPFKILKIDRSFIQDMQLNKKNESLIIAIITMARSLGLEVVAEGVEKEEQLTFLRTHQCSNVQGFLLSHPLPANDFTRIFDINKRNDRHLQA